MQKKMFEKKGGVRGRREEGGFYFTSEKKKRGRHMVGGFLFATRPFLKEISCWKGRETRKVGRVKGGWIKNVGMNLK